MVENSFVWLSAQRALLGAIDEQVLGVCIDRQDDTVVLTAYIENLVSDEEREALELAFLYIEADVYSEIPHSQLRIVENATNPLVTVGHWVFLRRGYQVTH